MFIKKLFQSEKFATEFQWDDEGETVKVSGSFNDWKEQVPLEKKYVYAAQHTSIFIMQRKITPLNSCYSIFFSPQSYLKICSG